MLNCRRSNWFWAAFFNFSGLISGSGFYALIFLVHLLLGVVNPMLKQLGKATFRLYGWTYQNDVSVLSDKQVVIGFEHTSNRDAILSLALFQIVGLKVHTLIKKNYLKVR